MKEIQIIQNFYNGKYPKDDCYFDGERLYTTDSLVEGTHFLHKWSSPKNVARKLIEVNISDILASGGIPEFCFLNLGLSDYSKQGEWVAKFTKEFKNVLKSYGIFLAGGDSFYSKKTFLSLTLVSKKQKHKPITREHAEVNDFLYITGAVGFSYLGYKLLKKERSPKSLAEKFAIQKHLEPKSRMDLQKILSKLPINAMMDITDGLIQDLNKLSLC
ncbi:MAG: thiamine-phosphate kinase, partial [Leptospiraceae bacterium]|nr:thiamine-phosphate kinase [Leptospiraceae bacterium]